MISTPTWWVQICPVDEEDHDDDYQGQDGDDEGHVLSSCSYFIVIQLGFIIEKEGGVNVKRGAG